MKRIVQSSIGAVLLIVLNFAVLAFVPTDEIANGTITARPLWVEVLAFPLRYGAQVYKRLLLAEAANSWTLLRWSDVVASFVGAFLFFGITAYIFRGVRGVYRRHDSGISR